MQPEFIIMQSSPKPTLPVPVAMLVIYDTGFKFKYKKYYLREGTNLIGSHPSCHVIISEANVPEKAAVIELTTELATMQPCKERCVYVPANMKKKSKVLVEIDAWTKYVIEMERDFSICGRKAMMQVSTIQELLLVKGVANADHFDLSHKPEGNPARVNCEPRTHPSSYDSTLPMESQSVFEPTMQMANTYELYEPTQVIPDEGAFEPTLALDQDLIPQSYHRDSGVKPNPGDQLQVPASAAKSNKNGSEQKNSKAHLSHSENRAISEAQVSMPSTLREDQDQMPATLREEDAIISSVAASNVFTFPPTLEQQAQIQLDQIQRQNQTLSKSEPMYRQIKADKASRFDMNFSMKEKKHQPIDSFEDLFGGMEHVEQSNRTISLKSQNSKIENKPFIRQTNSQNQSQKTEKLEDELDNSVAPLSSGKHRKSKMDKIPEEAQHSQSQRDQKKICLVYGKLARGDQDRLISKGYQIVEDAEVSDLSSVELILVEGQWRLSKNLLLALVEGKDIKPAGWVRNQNAKPLGKLQGFLIEHILRRKGRGNNIFDGHKNFFLQEEVGSEFRDVMVAAGASLVEQLDKKKSKTVIHIIVDEKTEDGRELYKQYKNYKNWSFYSRRAIVESTLMGEQILDKYKLDAYSF